MLTSSLAYEGDALRVDSVPVEDIAADCGTPLYLYSRAGLEARFRALDEAFRDRPHRILFSVKANSNLAVLGVLARAGAGADVVSGGELIRAIRAGIPPDRIVFAGVGKTDEELEAALSHRIRLVNIESPGEFARLGKVAARMGVTADVAFRITPGVVGKTHAYTETGTKGTKFGVPLEEALALAAAAGPSGSVRVKGIHVHFGSQITTLDPFLQSAARARDAVGAFREAGVHIESVNLGGGLGISYSDETPPAPAELAAGLSGILPGPSPELFFEPGRYLAGPAGFLVARVIDVKTTGERLFTILDAGMNDLIRPSLYGAWHEALPVRRSADREEAETDLVGPICESGDFLAKGRRMPRLEAGELVLFRDAGAYGFTMASNYNTRPRAAEVLVEDGGWRIVRRRETIEDLLGGESI